MSHSGPDEQSIITYVSQFLEHFPGLEEVGLPSDFERNRLFAADRISSAFSGSLSRKSPSRRWQEAPLCADSTSATGTPTTEGTALREAG